MNLPQLISNNKQQILIVFMTCGIWFISGFDLILISANSKQIESLYFPNIDESISILALYATLSVSLLARVFGGIFFGRLADRFGRRPIVLLCLFSMTILMLISAYLPSIYTLKHDSLFDRISPISLTISFIVLRIFVGFFVGGLWPTAAILGLENIFPIKFNTIFNKLVESNKISTIDVEFQEPIKRQTLQSSLMQMGLFAGYLVSVILIVLNPKGVNDLTSIFFPHYVDFDTWRSMSFIGFVVGLILFILYRFTIKESEVWSRWYGNKECLKSQSLHNSNKSTNEIENIGILALLRNKDYKETVIGFWLILSGLMYMYYSTVLMTPELLVRDGILDSNWNLILIGLALPSHFALGIILYKAWVGKTNIRYKTIANAFETLINFVNWVSLSILRLFHSNINQNQQEFTDEVYNKIFDLQCISVIGFVLVILGLIGTCMFILIPINYTFGPLIIFFVSIVILIANSGWALVPSMLASRFPTGMRATGASFVYNGGLVVSFASPFLIMEFYIYMRSEYIVFIAMVLAAVSMIIGAWRLMTLVKNSTS